MAKAAKVIKTLIGVLVKPINVSSLVVTIIKKKDQLKGGKLSLSFVIDCLSESQ